MANSLFVRPHFPTVDQERSTLLGVGATVVLPERPTAVQHTREAERWLRGQRMRALPPVVVGTSDRIIDASWVRDKQRLLAQDLWSTLHWLDHLKAVASAETTGCTDFRETVARCVQHHDLGKLPPPFQLQLPIGAGKTRAAVAIARLAEHFGRSYQAALADLLSALRQQSSEDTTLPKSVSTQRSSIGADSRQWVRLSQAVGRAIGLSRKVSRHLRTFVCVFLRRLTARFVITESASTWPCGALHEGPLAPLRSAITRNAPPCLRVERVAGQEAGVRRPLLVLAA